MRMVIVILDKDEVALLKYYVERELNLPLTKMSSVGDKLLIIRDKLNNAL
jgi:hypothetical protein